MSTQIVRDFCQVETRLFYSLSVNQLNLLAQYKGYNQKERVEWYIENQILGVSVHLPPF